MNIEEIPSDELIEMSEIWHRAFNAAGCNPGCHCCNKFINVNDKFKLSTIPIREPIHTNYLDQLDKGIESYKNGTISESKEVMLCDKCTVEMFIKKDIENLKERKKLFVPKPEHQGCFRINGKIVH